MFFSYLNYLKNKNNELSELAEENGINFDDVPNRHRTSPLSNISYVPRRNNNSLIRICT